MENIINAVIIKCNIKIIKKCYEENITQKIEVNINKVDDFLFILNEQTGGKVSID